MNDIKYLRDQYNFSQSFFAVWLNITKSQLSMAELGQRRLPKEATEKLIWLEKQMLPAKQIQASSCMESNTSFQESDAAAVRQFLQEEIVGYKCELYQYGKKLSNLRLRREKAIACLALAETIRKQARRAKDFGPDLQLINMAQLQAATELEKIPASKILRLELKITGLNAQLAIAENKLSTLERPLDLTALPEVPAVAAIEPIAISTLQTAAGGVVSRAPFFGPKVPMIQKNNFISREVHTEWPRRRPGRIPARQPRFNASMGNSMTNNLNSGDSMDIIAQDASVPASPGGPVFKLWNVKDSGADFSVR